MMDETEQKRWERNLARLVRMAGEGDAEQFAAIVKMLECIPDRLREAATKLRQPTDNGSRGYSWTDLGNALGTSRQNAQVRFGERVTDQTRQEEAAS